MSSVVILKKNDVILELRRKMTIENLCQHHTKLLLSIFKYILYKLLNICSIQLYLSVNQLYIIPIFIAFIVKQIERSNYLQFDERYKIKLSQAKVTEHLLFLLMLSNR